MSPEQKIYRVATEARCGGKEPEKTLAYATGKPENIKEFYDDQKMYELHVEEIEVTDVTPELLKEHRKLLRQREELIRQQNGLERDWKTLERRLSEMGGAP